VTRLGAEHRSSVLVAALSAAFGVALVLATDILSAYITTGELAAEHGSVRLAVLIVAAVFLVIAVYVGAIVTTNTFATIVAGRTRTIALLRLIGSSARDQRARVAREGLSVGALGAVIGLAVGYACAAGVAWGLQATGTMTVDAAVLADPLVAAPVLAVIATTWLASWVGSRRVLAVTPMHAIGNAEDASFAEARARTARNTVAVVLVGLGAGLLAIGIGLSIVTPFAVLISLVGGVLSFSGIIAAGPFFIPLLVRLIAFALGRSAPARLAAANAIRYPDRTARTTVGLVIGVTLITMFAVAAACYEQMIRVAQESDPQMYSGVDAVLTVTVSVFAGLIGFSAAIAAVGLVNNLALSVLQRRRELGLLRTIGLAAVQVRALVACEAVLYTVTSVVGGVALGTFYGWAGAQSLLGSIPGSGFIAPVVPLQVLVGCGVVAAVLSAVASLGPTRRVLAESPVAAITTE
jgi:putative ABC transport system permease protein